MMCDKCGYIQIFFTNQRDKNGVFIPLDRTGKPHDCDHTSPFPCISCGSLVYLDKKVLSIGSNKRRLLEPGTDTYHFCSKEVSGSI